MVQPMGKKAKNHDKKVSPVRKCIYDLNVQD